MSHRIRRIQQLPIAATPLVATFGLFGERLEVRTNDPRVVAAAEASFGRFAEPPDGAPLVVRLVVADGEPGGGPDGDPTPPDGEPGGGPDGDSTPPDPRDLVHDTAGHLLAIGLGAASRAVVDADRGWATGSVSPAVAGQAGLLRYAFVEAMALAMLTGGRGYVPIHASCVVRDGVGMILQAPAGTGKSTLAFACARRGWGLLAEDVVFARPRDGHGADAPLELWGMPWTQRLMPDTPRFFPELATSVARLQANGEHKLEVDLDVHLPGAATPRAAAGPVVLLARDTGGPTRAEWLDAASSPAEVEVLWPWQVGWTSSHEATATRLLAHGLLRLHLNGRPDEAVDALERALAAPAGASGTASQPVASQSR
ncbi:MAG: hypothetical protein AB1736_02640 [Chloroflexota bacterium]